MNRGARFIHTADWQIGLHARHVTGDENVEVRTARYDTVRRIAEVARDVEADFVVVAGDVFDHHQLDRVPLQRSFEALRAFACDVYLLPGNHDPFTPDALYRSDWWTRECPPHVKVLTQRRPIELPHATLLPCPLLERHTHDPTAWLGPNVGPSDRIRVGVAHGAVTEILQGLTGDDEVEVHNDIPIGLADRARLDYLALGDWHGRLRVNDRTWYSGTPEPTRFKERDPGHVLAVEIEQPRAQPKVTAHRVAKFTWHRITATLSTADHVTALERQLAELPDRNDTLVELTLEGQLDLQLRARLDHDLIVRYRGIFKHLRVRDERLAVRLNDSDLAVLPRDGWVGKVVERLRNGVEGHAPEGCQEALRVLHDLHAKTIAAGGLR
jgi:DNA repair exonuclease SbcCD nuclease subunit